MTNATKADAALEAVAALGLSKSDFAELALLALDQAGIDARGLRGLVEYVAPLMDRGSIDRWRKESSRWPL